MKKWLSLILVAVLTLSLLAGCAAKTTDQPAASTDTAADAAPADTADTTDTAEPAEAETTDGKVLKVGISWAHCNDALF